MNKNTKEKHCEDTQNTGKVHTDFNYFDNRSRKSRSNLPKRRGKRKRFWKLPGNNQHEIAEHRAIFQITTAVTKNFR